MRTDTQPESRSASLHHSGFYSSPFNYLLVDARAQISDSTGRRQHPSSRLSDPIPSRSISRFAGESKLTTSRTYGTTDDDCVSEPHEHHPTTRMIEAAAMDVTVRVVNVRQFDADPL
jgi:hypothetical protein